LALLSYDCRLAWFGPSFRRNMWVDAKPSEESCKASPISPNQLIQGKKPASQKDARKRSGAGEQSTSDHEAPRAVVATTTVVAVPLPSCFGFSATLCYPTWLFFGLCCVLHLKRGCIWLKRGDRFRGYSLLHSQYSIEEEEGRRRRISRRRHWKRIERSTFYPSISFLNSLSFFHFLQF